MLAATASIATPWPVAPGRAMVPESMATRTRPTVASANAQVMLAPEDERRLLAAVEHAARGETLALTAEETARYCETGELPERMARWTASRD
jgi:hypothetical protein